MVETRGAVTATLSTFEAHLVLVHGLLGLRRDHPLPSGPLDGGDIPLLPLDGRLNATPEHSEL